MNFKGFIADEDAVSPVIGVILMVAITVILAAVIASFVLGLGDQTQSTTPQASFAFDYDSANSEIDITHDGGDTINSDELFIRGTLSGSNSIDQSWTSVSGGSATDVTAGNSITIDGTTAPAAPGDDYDIRLVFESDEGDNSATLGQDTGPDA